MILLRDLHLYPGEDMDAAVEHAAKKLGVPSGEIIEARLVRRSLDARKKADIHYVCSLSLRLRGEKEKQLLKRKRTDLAPYPEAVYEIPHVEAPRERPVVAGFGPAGMFAALLLARAGARPVVIERGCDADTRLKAVERFRSEGVLDPENNVQFGEGGAGTFSDGKLNTGTHDRRIAWVLRQFYEHGAPESVLYDAKPHIGTDVLVGVVKALRHDIEAHGGEVRFRTRLDSLRIEEGKLRVAEVTGPDGAYTLPCSTLILALGHSARDSFRMLHALGLPMEQKPFSMGVRIEHSQKSIDLAQYGRERDVLPPADYGLHVRFSDDESAYTFCMCPGGEVIAAASEEGGVVTNGMSLSRRSGENANAALLVTLRPEDFPGSDVLAGMDWQRRIEQAAYAYGGGNYNAPAQLVGDFLARRPSTEAASVIPSYRPGVVWGELRDVLPDKICRVLEKALPAMGRKLRGFDDPDAVMTAPETRSSSPVRILRGEDLCSPAASGVFPCGEGAGYAGGITSAAVDGLRCAEALLAALGNKEE